MTTEIIVTPQTTIQVVSSVQDIIQIISQTTENVQVITQGIQGPTGGQGPIGPAGPQGPAGPTGPPSTGTVSYVGLQGDGTVFNTSVPGSPITGAGTLAPTLANQSPHTFLAGSSTSATTTPSFRALALSDFPSSTPNTLAGYNSSGAFSDVSIGTGITVTASTVTANISTGIAGGQSAIGGINSGDDLTLVSNNSGSTPGQIFLGAAQASFYDENNEYLLLQHNNIGTIGSLTTFDTGVYLQNITSAAAATQQISPLMVWEGQGWATTPVDSQSAKFAAYVLPIQGAANPSSEFILASSLNGAVLTTVLQITSGGIVEAATGLGTTNTTNGNFWMPAATTSTAETLAQYLFAGATTVNGRTLFYGSTSTALGIGASYGAVIIGSAPTTTAASGTHAMLANVVVKKIGTITQGLSTVTRTASLYIDGAATATVTDQNYAFYVSTGASTLNGGLALPLTGILKGNGTNTAITVAIPGTDFGTVTSFSSGNLTPLFTTSVTTATTTPALSFALTNAPPNTVFGNDTNSTTAPAFQSSINITGNMTAANIIATSQLISTIATGTSPLSVASTTQVANLNAANAGTAANANLVATTLVSNNASYYLGLFSTTANINQAADLASTITYNPSTDTLATTNLNISGTATIANLTVSNTVTSANMSASGTISAATFNSGGFTTSQLIGTNTLKDLTTIFVGSGLSLVGSTLSNSSPSSGGTVTQINTGTGMTGGQITGAGTVAMITPVTVALGGTNATSASVTAFNNITGYSASGATGVTSTNLVFSSAPTFTSNITVPVIYGGNSTNSSLTLAGSSSSPSGDSVIFQTDGATSGTITGKGAAVFGQQFTGALAQPFAMDFGNSAGNNTAGTTGNLKLQLYHSGSNLYGLGISAFLLEYQAGTTASHGFYVNAGTLALFIKSNQNIGLGGVSNPSQIMTNSSTGSYAWDNGSGTADTGFSRASAGVIDVGNGTAGNTSGSMVMAGLTASGTVTAANATVSGQLISTVATGTAPLVVSSTTQVANLNAATAGTATNAAKVATTSVSNNAVYYPLFSGTTANVDQAVNLDASGYTYNPSTNTLTLGGTVSAATFNSSGLTASQLVGTNSLQDLSTIFVGSGLQLVGSTLSSTSGGGSVTSFSAANLSPLFTTSVTTATTTPALSFSLTNAPANTVFSNNTSSTAAPAFQSSINITGSLTSPTHIGTTAQFTDLGTFAGLTVTGSSIPPNGIYLPSANTVGISANSVLQSIFTTTASAVNLIAHTGGAAGASPVISIGGSGADTNQNLNLTGIGTGNVQIKGIGTIANATAGYVGEYVTANASGVTLSSAIPANVTSISLTAGDWDVGSEIGFAGAAGTTAVTLLGGINTTTASFPGAPDPSFLQINAAFTASTTQFFPLGVKRYLLSTTTTVFLVGQANFSVSTMTGSGVIWARRIR